MKEPAFCFADLLERAAFVIRTRCGDSIEAAMKDFGLRWR